MEVLQNFAFPGNVRQLENVCHWITVMAPGSSVDEDDLPPEVRVAAPSSSAATATGYAESMSVAPVTAAAYAPAAPAPPAAHAVASIAPAASSTTTTNNGNSAATGDWQHALSSALAAAIQHGEHAPGERLTREFEATMIRSALTQTKGRRIEASEWLGWGRNTLTRKIHELGMDGEV